MPRKHPDFDETLRLMKIVEKNMSEQDKLLDGNFSISSTYNSHTSQVNYLNGQNWKGVWKCNVIERARIVSGNLSHNVILTNEKRGKRMLTDDTSYVRCSNPIESSLHAIRDCPIVRLLWMDLVSPFLWQHFFNMDINDWINENLRKDFGQDASKNKNSIFGTTCWFIWKQINDYFFGLQ
ncbi:putative ribonuclease H-like domain, reverse transcriptase zinc-binding domain-containing protein [Senna tora]|uniref:Putative ribonuclease H-like domain, reverse transcriptase zinc-binding domain-containing protein n=1 Tax=Senna tora TaxID=362788 RepID=A0A834TA84_9FABA|nr:putative ribonuclease H-like domain, reverse transcriptase zinc-binding domain-containing protein [Senna tora]